MGRAPSHLDVVALSSFAIAKEREVGGPLSAQPAPPRRCDPIFAGQRTWNSIGQAESLPFMEIEEIPTVGADPLTQASLCLGSRVAPGVDPVPAVLDEVAIPGL